MIQISESAQTHFRKLIEREALPGLGVRLSAVAAGTARADVRLEFTEPVDLNGDEWAVDCEGFTLWLEAASVNYLDGAQIDYEVQATGGQLQIRAPRIKGETPGESASVVERVHWLVEHEINPQLAQHGGHVAVQEVTGEGVVVLRFGGGCHGCGMADVTLKQGIEKTLLEKVPGVTAVRDATDHDTGAAPYIAREAGPGPAA
ncbi:NfuA family Fe-S biogenesis protein [Lysobacter sp. D1-1-M9]|uniref:NfuA family Fe-S biogenesis protein n=1 Tax=Novilysobacter longmucuonensis TaxID=3098603 RepID=UPI002FCC71EB